MSVSASSAFVAESMSLRDVLEPVSIETFVADYWGRKALLIKGEERKFSCLLNLDELKRASTRSSKVLLRASTDRGKSLFDIPPSEVDRAYAQGATVCATHVQAGSESLMLFCRTIERQLNYPGIVDLRAYLSPQGTGFDLHYDARITTSLQIEGSKTWRYSTKPHVAWPQTNSWIGGEREAALGCEFEEVTLEAGDLLCLPAGTWHAARAGEHSLALNLAIVPVDFLGMVADQWQSKLRSEPYWREPLPPAGAIATGETLPHSVGTYLASRFSNLGKMCDEISRDPDALLEFWYESLVRNRSVVSARASVDGPAHAAESDVFTLSADIDLHYVTHEQERRVVLYYGPPAGRLNLPLQTRDFVEALQSRNPIGAASVQSLIGCSTWAEARVFLEQLLARGLITAARRA